MLDQALNSLEPLDRFCNRLSSLSLGGVEQSYSLSAQRGTLLVFPQRATDWPSMPINLPKAGCDSSQRTQRRASFKSNSNCCSRSGDAMNPNQV